MSRGAFKAFLVPRDPGMNIGVAPDRQLAQVIRYLCPIR